MTRRRTVLVASVGAAALVAATAPFVYAALNRAPESLVTRRLSDGPTILAADLNGAWDVAEGSVVGYRVEEQIALAKTDGVGRTSEVSGRFVVADGSLLEARFEVDLASLQSDRSQRDQQVRTKILDVATHPVAEFVLTEPVALPPSTDVATMSPFVATGDLTLRGVTKPVAVAIYAAIDDGRLRLTGSTEIVFAEWGIPNPSIPAALIFTKDRGTLEFDLLFQAQD
jgi:polyisoprenoid-binding protein YceI